MRSSSAPVVLEGRLVLARALGHPAWRVTRLLATPAALEALGDVLDATPADRRPSIETVSHAALEAEGGFRFHQGCLGYAERPAPARWQDWDLSAALDRRCLVVVLEDVRDPDNVGSIFRAALAFGARGVLLGPGCADPLYRKAIRTSMAATLALPFAPAEPWPDALDLLAARGLSIVATTPDPGAETLADVRASLPRLQPLAILVGSEGAGLSAAAMTHAHRRVRIPVAASVDSLNVASATAIVLYELH